MNPYANICAACDHPTSRHTLRKCDELVDGPYDCRIEGCDCSRKQRTEDYGLTRSQYEKRFDQKGRPRRVTHLLCYCEAGGSGGHYHNQPDVCPIRAVKRPA